MNLKADFTSSKSIYLPEDVEQQELISSFTGVVTGSRASAVTLKDGHDQIRVPDELVEILRAAAVALQAGRGVTIVPTGAQLTTQEPAGFLEVSRPTLVKVLESGDLPFAVVGRHRRVLLRDLRAYHEDFVQKSRKGWNFYGRWLEKRRTQRLSISQA